MKPASSTTIVCAGFRGVAAIVISKLPFPLPKLRLTMNKTRRRRSVLPVEFVGQPRRPTVDWTVRGLLAFCVLAAVVVQNQETSIAGSAALILMIPALALLLVRMYFRYRH